MNACLEERNEPASIESVEKEFSDFVYIVSHDLNAPLRHIKQATDILLGKLEGKLTDDERRFSTIIEKSVKKSQLMMQALTQYSRLNTQCREFRDVDCNELVADVIEDFQALIQERQATFSLAPLPVVFGDKGQLTLLFHHLIENALAYCREDDEPVIKVKSVPDGALFTFTVEDNGEGIDEKLRERIFEMFYRINPSSPHSGIGGGLTICKKIVSRHGGQIWAEASESNGTAIVFNMVRR